MEGRKTGNGPVLTLAFVMMAMILHYPLQASVRYTPLSVTHLWSLVKVSNMNYSQEFYVLVTVHHERRVKREKPTGCN